MVAALLESSGRAVAVLLLQVELLDVGHVAHVLRVVLDVGLRDDGAVVGVQEVQLDLHLVAEEAVVELGAGEHEGAAVELLGLLVDVVHLADHVHVVVDLVRTWRSKEIIQLFHRIQKFMEKFLNRR